MEQRKDVLTIGIFALVLAIVLRFGFLPLENPNALSVLIYLQTGRWVRYPGTAAEGKPPAVTTPTQPPTQPKPSGIYLSSEDIQAVELNNLTDYAPNLQQLGLSPLSWDLTENAPKVLILHTHATESYTRQPGEIYEEDSDYRTFNSAYNMLSVGEELKKVLEAGGVSVLHDQSLHDYPSFNGSYSHARETIATYLQAFPSICMVIDLHRDALDFSQEPQLTTLASVNGQRSAQLMLVAGTDTNAAFENWEENLALGVKLNAVLEKLHPGITRPMQLRAQRFNLDMTPGSLLVEVGANGNSHAEAILAVRALGEAIIAMANGVNL